MQQQHALTILYDLASTVGGEVSLSPLLSKTLQRIMHHTGIPCGMMLLNENGDGSGEDLVLATTIGDRLLMKHVDHKIELPPTLRDSTNCQLLSDPALIASLPCRQDKYHSALLLPIPGEGVILLLCTRPEPATPLPLEMIFPPILANLGKAIHLCRLNDKQKELLRFVVKERTGQLQQALETIDQQRKSLQAILNHAPIGIWMLDNDRRLKFANPAITEALGITEQQMIEAGGYAEVLPAGLAEEQREADRLCLDESHEHISQITLADAEPHPRTFDVIRAPILDADNKVSGLVGMAIEITERLEAEAEKALIQKRIEHTQRLESLGVLAGGIAHDFNNILAAVMGNAELARHHIHIDVGCHSYIDAIIKASQSAADLCGQMLAYSGQGEFVIKPINLSDVVNHMTQLLKVSISKPVDIKYHLQEELPAVDADISQIQQIIMNLITNANEAIGDSPGSITISTGTQMIDESYLANAYLHDSIEPGSYIYVEVSDTGCGMDQETINRLFDPFFTTKFTGRGLGMSAVLGIIRGHKGTIKVYSEKGDGTTFKVFFPASSKEPITLLHAELEADDWQGKGTILVVDDDPMVLEIAEAVIKSIGFDTLSARDGLEALDIYRAHPDKVAAVFLDMTMPRMGGKETFAELRKINPAVKVILTSGYNEQNTVESFAGKGLAGYMQKPYRVAELRLKMRKVLSDS